MLNKISTMNELEFAVSKPSILDRIIGYFRIHQFLDNFRRVKPMPKDRFTRITSSVTVE